MKTGTGRWIVGEVRDGSLDPREVPERVEGTTGMSRKGWGTLGRERRTLWEVQGTLGEVRGPSRRTG